MLQDLSLYICSLLVLCCFLVSFILFGILFYCLTGITLLWITSSLLFQPWLSSMPGSLFFISRMPACMCRPSQGKESSSSCLSLTPSVFDLMSTSSIILRRHDFYKSLHVRLSTNPWLYLDVAWIHLLPIIRYDFWEAALAEDMDIRQTGKSVCCCTCVYDCASGWVYLCGSMYMDMCV